MTDKKEIIFKIRGDINELLKDIALAKKKLNNLDKKAPEYDTKKQLIEDNLQKKREALTDKQIEQKKEVLRQQKKEHSSSKTITRNTKKQERAYENVRQQMMLNGLTVDQANTGIKRLKKNFGQNNIAVNTAGKFLNETTGDVIGFNKAASMGATQAMPRFRAEFLSLLFIGQGIASTFQRMITSTLQMTGIFEAFKGILASILLPVLMPLISKWLPKLTEWLSKDENKKLAANFIILGFVFGKIISLGAQIALLLSALGVQLPTLGGVVLGVKNAFKALFVMIKGGKGAGKIFGKMIGGLQKVFGWLSIITGVFNIIWGFLADKIWPVLKGIALVAGGIALIFGGGWVAAIGAAIIAVVSLGSKLAIVRGIFGAIGTVVMGIAEFIIKIGQSIGAIFTGKFGDLSGIWTKNWNLTTGAAKFTGAQFGQMGNKGIFAKGVSTNLAGETKMATGGIVTQPTRALIGESGPEAVIPLDRAGDSGIGNNIQYSPRINVQMASTGLSENDLARKINEALYDSLQRGM